MILQNIIYLLALLPLTITILSMFNRNSYEEFIDFILFFIVIGSFIWGMVGLLK